MTNQRKGGMAELQQDARRGFRYDRSVDHPKAAAGAGLTNAGARLILSYLD